MIKILLIEDNREIRENTAELLDLEGFSVIEASNGRQGLEMAILHQPHLILCDIMMPEMNGYEVYTALKNEPDSITIPFIFLTANVENSSVQQAFDMGANGYIRKPFQTEELLSEIKKCLGR